MTTSRFSSDRVRKPRPAFTLIELLAVIAILMILLSLLVPSLRKARELARRLKCQSNSRCLHQADMQYNERYGCLSPMGYRVNTYPNNTGNPSVVWWQTQFLGQFFGEDVPKSLKVDDVPGVPPRKSVLRCPSESLWSYNHPLKSWIAYNSYMSSECEPRATNYRCYLRGPKIEEIFNPTDRLLLFGDGRGSGLYYVCDFAYNNGSYYAPDRAGMDTRHGGGVNAMFLDGHAAYFSDHVEAYFQHKIYLSIRSNTK